MKRKNNDGSADGQGSHAGWLPRNPLYPPIEGTYCIADFPTTMILLVRASLAPPVGECHFCRQHFAIGPLMKLTFQPISLSQHDFCKRLSGIPFSTPHDPAVRPNPPLIFWGWIFDILLFALLQSAFQQSLLPRLQMPLRAVPGVLNDNIRTLEAFANGVGLEPFSLPPEAFSQIN